MGESLGHDLGVKVKGNFGSWAYFPGFVPRRLEYVEEKECMRGEEVGCDDGGGWEEPVI